LKKNAFDNGKVVEGKSDSFCTLFMRKAASKTVLPFLLKRGDLNSVNIIIASFLMTMLSFGLILFSDDALFINRLIVTAFLALSFYLRCFYEEYGKYTRGRSIFEIWLFSYLGRIGEMMLYSSIGYRTWLSYGSFGYFVLGVFSGFIFLYHSLIYSMRDSVLFEEMKKREKNEKRVREIQKYREISSETLKNPKFMDKVRVYLNFGTGERYFFLIFFLLIGRTDIMVLIIFGISFVMSVYQTVLLSEGLKKIDRG
jgi:hypothetical protein